MVSIADGDPLTMLDFAKRQHKVRIQGIDAPEKKQPFGARSRQSLADMAFSAQAVAECSKRDRYGRLVCKVSVGQLDVGLEQVRRGMAWWYRRYQAELTTEERLTYGAAEKEARSSQVGLWHERGAIAPWDFRAKRRAQ